MPKEDESVNHKTERLIQSANEFGGLDNIGVLLIERENHKMSEKGHYSC